MAAAVPRVHSAHTSMSAAAALVASQLTTGQRDAINGIEIRMRNVASMSRMMAEAQDQDWDDAQRAFYEMSYTLDLLADRLQDATHPSRADGEGRA